MMNGATHLEAAAPGEVIVKNGAGAEQEIVIGRHWLFADRAVADGGTDRGPNPYDLLCASLGACTSMTLLGYARRRQWPLESVTVRVRHSGNYGADCNQFESRSGVIDRIERDIELGGPLSDEQRSRLLEVARRCPVQRTLTSELHIRTRLAK